MMKVCIVNIRVMVVVFNATFNNISVILWQLVSLVEDTGVQGENQRPVTVGVCNQDKKKYFFMCSCTFLHFPTPSNTIIIKGFTRRNMIRQDKSTRASSCGKSLSIQRDNNLPVNQLKGLNTPTCHSNINRVKLICNSVEISTDCVSSNLDQGEVYNIM